MNLLSSCQDQIINDTSILCIYLYSTCSFLSIKYKCFEHQYIDRYIRVNAANSGTLPRFRLQLLKAPQKRFSTISNFIDIFYNKFKGMEFMFSSRIIIKRIQVWKID